MWARGDCVCPKGTGKPWQSFEQGRVTGVHKRSLWLPYAGRSDRARVEVWSPGGGQGRDSSGESTGWTWAGLWEREEEVGEKDRNMSGPWGWGEGKGQGSRSRHGGGLKRC